MEHNKTITYSYLDSKDWKEKTRTAEIDFIKTYAANDFAVHLKNGKVIFVEPIRTELWGKSGKRLSIITNSTNGKRAGRGILPYKAELTMLMPSRNNRNLLKIILQSKS